MRGSAMKRSIRCVAMSPQGGDIAVGSYDGHIARYDAITHELLCPETYRPKEPR